MTTKQKLNFIDEVLERLEDTAHGVDSNDLSTARKYLKEIEPFALLRLPEMPKETTEETWGELTVVHKVDENGRSRYYTTTKPPSGGNVFVEVKPGIEVDWNTAPKWANYHAVDEDGEGWWYGDEPMKGDGCAVWDIRNKLGKSDYSKHYDLNGIDWKQTLTKRP